MKLLRKLIGYRIALSPIKKSHDSRRMRLLNTIRHANENVPFYKGVYDNFLESEHELSDNEFFYAFSHLPIIEKSHLKEQNDAFKSDHLADKINLLQDGQTPPTKEFIKHAIIKKDFKASLSTGGSSGVPAFRWIDYEDANIFAQSFLHSFKLNGWKTGESFTVFYPLKSYFTGVYADQAKNLNRYFGFTMVPFEELNKDTVLELLETLKKTKSTLLVIFPCVLQRIAQIMHDENIEPFENLPYINISGEFFMDCSKSFIQKMFPDSDIQSTYGAVEFGEIAHQKALNSFEYNVFDDYAYLEQGPNNTMLVTSYHQRAFPLIRYRIEDMGQIINNDDGTQSIQYLEGKNTDYLIGADNYMYFASYFNHTVNEINKKLHDPIIHFMLRHGEENGSKYMQLNFVILKRDKIDKIKKEIKKTIGKIFSNYDNIEINFPEYFEHDYTRKFKIIGEGDGQAEVVGGYYQRKAS
ncbi:MAG: hypothetical protein ACRBDI_00075 [Alphaproteobacteria bacterium]